MAQHQDHPTDVGISRAAYALASIAVSFRVTHVVDIVRGVHAMIPKGRFTGKLRRRIAVA